MSNVVLVCKAVEKEIELLMKKTGYTADKLVSFEPGLHDHPDTLKKKIEMELEDLTEPSRVLFTLGYCGGAVNGIMAGKHTLIAPKVDDCLTLLLGSPARRIKIQNEGGAFFLTAGWIDKDDSFVNNYQRYREKFGLVRALKMEKMYLGNYKRFMFIETGLYNPDDYMERLKPLAESAGMVIERVPGDLAWLTKLFETPSEADDYVIIEPGGQLNLHPLAIN